MNDRLLARHDVEVPIVEREHAAAVALGATPLLRSGSAEKRASNPAENGDVILWFLDTDMRIICEQAGQAYEAES